MARVLTPAQMEAAKRVVLGEGADLIARECGVPASEVQRWVARLQALGKDVGPRSEELKRIVATWASDFGYVAGSGAFRFPAVAGIKTYNPDVVWCDRDADMACAAVIFEVDDDVSVKHRVGGAALANIAALTLQRRLHYFAVAPMRHQHVAATSIDVLEKYLGDRWMLNATVIPTFQPAEVRARVAGVLTAQGVERHAADTRESNDK